MFESSLYTMDQDDCIKSISIQRVNYILVCGYRCLVFGHNLQVTVNVLKFQILIDCQKCLDNPAS